ncbi:MAG: iron-sulfur cluster assembly scaffold protein [Pseudomonadota bacterium]
MRYSATVREHFARPRNAGRFAASVSPVASGDAGRVETGARVAIDLHVETATVAAVRWRVYGCPHLLAATSIVSERLCGAAVADLGELRLAGMAEELELPTEKLGLLLVLEDAVHAAAAAATGLRESARNITTG